MMLTRSKPSPVWPWRRASAGEASPRTAASFQPDVQIGGHSRQRVASFKKSAGTASGRTQRQNFSASSCVAWLQPPERISASFPRARRSGAVWFRRDCRARPIHVAAEGVPAPAHAGGIGCSDQGADGPNRRWRPASPRSRRAPRSRRYARVRVRHHHRERECEGLHWRRRLKRPPLAVRTPSLWRRGDQPAGLRRGDGAGCCAVSRPANDAFQVAARRKKL